LCHGTAAGYKGGYFRYGALSWQQTKIEADGITVKFTLKTAWARAYFSRGAANTPWGTCVRCLSGQATNAGRECDNIPPTKQRQDDCMLPVPGDLVAIYDAVDTSDLDNPTLGGALPQVETTFTFGDDPAKTLTGARQRTARQYAPKCMTQQDNGAFFGKCINGVVVDSFDTAISTPSPEADARDITYVVSEFTYKYPRRTATYKVGFQGCCRMGSNNSPEGAASSSFYDLYNNANGAFFLRSDVSVTDLVGLVKFWT